MEYEVDGYRYDENYDGSYIWLRHWRIIDANSEAEAIIAFSEGRMTRDVRAHLLSEEEKQKIKEDAERYRREMEEKKRKQQQKQQKKKDDEAALCEFYKQYLVEGDPLESLVNLYVEDFKNLKSGKKEYTVEELAKMSLHLEIDGDIRKISLLNFLKKTDSKEIINYLKKNDAFSIKEDQTAGCYKCDVEYKKLLLIPLKDFNYRLVILPFFRGVIDKLIERFKNQELNGSLKWCVEYAQDGYTEEKDIEESISVPRDYHIKIDGKYFFKLPVVKIKF